jgi:hypothetical protein
MNYRGENPLTVGFDGIRQDFSLANPVQAPQTTIIGTPMYAHKTQPATRARATVGARD